MAPQRARTHHDPHRDPLGVIGKKYGAMRISILRRAYGSEFALGVADWMTVGQVLSILDEPSLAKLVWDTPGAS